MYYCIGGCLNATPLVPVYRIGSISVMHPSALPLSTLPTPRTHLLLRGATLRLRLPVVMRHLEPSPPETALNIEALVRLGAVQYALVAADLLRNKVERLDGAQAKLLALLVLRDGNVLDVADEPEVVDELALDDEGTGADDAVRRVEDGEQEVLVIVLREPLVALVPLL